MIKGQTDERNRRSCAVMEIGLQKSPMSLSSRRESDLPFMPSRLSRSRDRSLDERSRSLDDLRDVQGNRKKDYHKRQGSEGILF